MTYLDEKESTDAIIEIGKRLWARQMVAANDGNISCRIGENLVICTPTGVSKGYMTSEMLVKIDLNGTVISGAYKATSEIKMHLQIYKENPKMLSVVHAHPITATAFACARVAMEKPIIPDAFILLGSVPVAPYKTPGTEELSDSVIPYCRNHGGVLLANHGVTTWGTDPFQAYFRMELVESYARILLNAEKLPGGGKEFTLSEQKDLLETRKKLNMTFSD